MWRILSLVILSFWLVMTALLVRYTWFPDGTVFSEVPPRVVLQQFLEQGSAVSNAGTLHIYRREEKIGDATLTCRRSREKSTDFSVRVDGVLYRGALAQVEDEIRWGFTLRLIDVDTFGEIKGTIRFQDARRIIDFLWKRGDRVPLISLRGNEGDVDSMMMQTMITQMLSGGGAGMMGGLGGLGGLGQDLGAAPSTDISSLIQMKAHDGEMDFAGQKSKGYMLDFTAMERWKARAFITEAGELVLVDLPEGYRLVEPVIHNLAPDYDAEDEAELAAEAAAAAAKEKEAAAGDAKGASKS